VTTQKSQKRRVRARMSKTGERYTAARRQLLAKDPAETSAGAARVSPATSAAEPTPNAAAIPASVPAGASSEPSTATPFRGERTSSDGALVTRTGRTWDEWFAILDAWGAADRPHAEIARWLNTEQGVGHWWCQEVTVGYEMAIGRRQPGQRPDGFSVSASKTVAVPVERLYAAFVDDDQRARWLAGVTLRPRTATPHRTARFDWDEGSARLAIGFTAKTEGRSTVALAISRLPDEAAAAGAKATWRQHLDELKRTLEG
jgi:uncharacterized protein YndB with AHSA1/START domain